MSQKIYSPQEAALAVLKKAEELLKSEKHKHIGWDKLHSKLESEGYSDKSADKIAGSIKAKVEKSEKDVTPSDDVRHAKAPNNNPDEEREGNNPPAGTTPNAVGPDGKVIPGVDEVRGHIKLAKFIGHMEHKKKTRGSDGQGQ